MVHEVKYWKKPDCALTVEVADLSDRETFSREINEEYGEGGGLNANYRTVEATTKAANLLGKYLGMEYGKDFVFKTGSGSGIIFDFKDEKTKKAAECFLVSLPLT